jgi:uncharacterized protein YjlB
VQLETWAPTPGDPIPNHPSFPVLAYHDVDAARAAGDVLVLPAGTGHRRAADRDGFRVVGAYPPGQEDYDVLREADDAARRRIAELGAPGADPVGGEGVGRWRAQ